MSHQKDRFWFVVGQWTSTLSACHPGFPSHPPALSCDTVGSTTRSSRAVRGSGCDCGCGGAFVDMAARLGEEEEEDGMNVSRLPNQTRATSGARKREDPCLPSAISAVL